MRLLLVAALVACASSACDYSQKEHESAQLTGAIDAKVMSVKKKTLTVDAVGGGHIGILVPARQTKEWCELRVTKPKKLALDVSPPCKADDPAYQLAADPEGKRLAHAPGNGSWSVLYFGTNDRSFEGTYVGPKGPIDWASVPTLEKAFADLLAAQMAYEARLSDYDKAPPDLLLDEIASRGDAELARVLVASMAAPVEGERLALDPEAKKKRTLWSRGFDRLKPEGRAAVERALGEKLADLSLGKENAPAVVRAVLHLDVDKNVSAWAPKLADAVKARGEGEHDWPSDFAIGVLLARLAASDAKAAAPIGCTLVERSQLRAPVATDAGVVEETGDIVGRLDLTSAFAAVAAGALDCAAVRAFDASYEKKFETASPDKFPRGYCLMSGWYCPAWDEWRKPPVRCTAETARARVVERLKRPLAEERRAKSTFDELHQALAAAVLVKGVPLQRARAIDRQLYTRFLPEGLRQCTTAEEDDEGDAAADAAPVKAGTRRCDPGVPTLDAPSMCQPASVVEVYESVVVHYDDKKKEIFYTSRPRKSPYADAGARD